MSYCLKCGKNIESKNSKAVKKTLEEQCFHQTMGFVVVKKSRFTKEQEAIGILGSITNALSKIHRVGHILF